MNHFKLMTILIFIMVIGILVAVDIFVFQLNIESSHPGEFSFPLVWEFILTHPIYSLGIIAPTIATVIAVIKISRSKFEKFSFS